MNVIEEILKWSEKLPDWESDALRRIWVHGHLSKDDEDQVLKLLLSEHGVIPSADSGCIPRRLAASDVSAATDHGQDTIVRALHDVRNVNALRAGQRLEFGASGVSVIYGDNATGKSGYSRVLKRACRARGAAERIYPNVYAGKKPISDPATASFDVSMEEGVTETVTWTDGSPPPQCLANIAVFDSKVARVHVDEANEVVYVPYGLDVFTKLASLCRETLRSEIDRRIATLPQTPALVGEFVGPGKPIAAMNSETEPQTIIAATVFSENDEARLTALSKIVADYKANDPTKKAEGFRRLRSRIDRLRASTINLRKSLSDKSVAQFKLQFDGLIAAQQAASIASKKAFESEPLAGTGGEAWKVMFEAARHYSEQDAYPTIKFPATIDGSRCPLCQQDLDTNAKDRLNRFWTFVEQDVAKSVVVARQRVKDAQDVLGSMEANPLKGDPQFLDELRELSDATALEVESLVAALQNRLEAVRKALSDGTWATVPELGAYSGQGISSLSKQCEANAKSADALANPEEQARREEELRVVTLRKKLSENKQSLLDYLATLKTREKLTQCLEAVSTTGITRKQSDLMEEALTVALETALRREFTALGLHHLQLRVTKSGSIGSTYHRLSLPSETLATGGLSEVLSEGEHRVVAIASFLAELSTASHRNGIVFDDPVSSLDQRWRDLVARRLVEESKTRQVIIFTHDIVLLVALKAEAALQGVPLATQMVTRTPVEVGICSPRLATPIMNTGERLGVLRQTHQEIAAFHRNCTEEEYRPKVVEFYDNLRNTWERAIEEHLFGDVIYRFRLGVETQKLRGVWVDDQDVVDITNGMTKCSKWIGGHDHAGATGVSLPLPTELESDLKSLEDFRNRVVQRSVEVAKARKIRQTAPAVTA